MNVFIVFVKFLGWIVASGARLARLIGEEGGPKILEVRGPTTKMKNIISKKKKNGLGPPPPSLGSSLVESSIKNFGLFI